MTEGELVISILKILGLAIPVAAAIIAVRTYDARQASAKREAIWVEVRALRERVAQFVAREELERRFERIGADIKGHFDEKLRAHEKTEDEKFELRFANLCDRIEHVSELIKNGYGEEHV